MTRATSSRLAWAVAWPLVRPVLRSWARVRTNDSRTAPRPVPEAEVHAVGVGDSEVLLVGTGPASGWGALSHDQGLAGALARALAAARGQAVTVTAITHPRWTLGESIVRELPLERFDQVVIMMGLNDSLRATGCRRWRRQLTELVDLAAGERHRTVLVVGQHPPSSIPQFAGGLSGLADRRAALLNAASAEVCAEHPDARYVPLAHPRDAFRVLDRAAHYAEMAAEIAPAAVEALPFVRRGAAIDDPERLAAVAATGLMGQLPGEALDRITRRAAEVFRTEIAVVTLVDDERQWHLSHVGTDTAEVPIERSLCRITIESGEPLVVGDAARDARLAAQPVVASGEVRFYAGYPIKSVDGRPIGALCLLDSAPRDASAVDVISLRTLALMAQDELRSSEAVARVRRPSARARRKPGASGLA